MKRNYQPLRLNQFVGVDLVTNPSVISPNASIGLNNCENWPYFTISKCLGREEFHDTTIGATTIIESVHQLKLRDGTTKELVTTNAGKIYYSSAADVWTLLDSGLTTTNYLHSTIDYVNEYIVTDYGQNAPQSWDGSAGTTSDVDASCPKGYTCANYFRRLWMLGTVLNPHIAYFSNQDTKVFTTATDFINLDSPPGFRINGGITQRDKLIVGKDASICEIYYTGTTPSFAVKVLTDTAGCAAPHSWQALPDGTVMFVGWNNVYRIVGSDVKAVGDAIQSYFEASLPGETLNKNRMYNISSGLNLQKQQYWISVPASAESTNSVVLVYDYVNGYWFTRNWIVSALGQVRVNGEDRLYSGGYTGLAYREDYGNDNAGSDFSAYRDTAWTDCSFKGKKKCARVEILIEQTGNFDLSVDIFKDFSDASAVSSTVSVGSGAYSDSGIWDTGLWGTMTWSTDQVNQTAVAVDCVTLGEFDWLKIRVGSASKDQFFRVYAYTIWWKGIGYRYVTS